MFFFVLVLAFGLHSRFAVAQSAPSPAASPAYTDDGWVDPVVYSAAEKQAACRKYNNQVIGYYEHLYKVENCKYREIRSEGLVLNLHKLGTKISTVDGDVLAKLTAGEPIVESAKGSVKRSCKSLNGRYVTFTYTDVYLIENCTKRPFPEWASFLEHRKKAKRDKEEVIALPWKEFENIKTGAVLPSIVDAQYQDMKVLARNVDVIPLAQACKGLNGKDVSYVDRLYRIENCRKRQYDAAKFLRRTGGDLKMRELSSEQWLSLPDGKPMG